MVKSAFARKVNEYFQPHKLLLKELRQLKPEASPTSFPVIGPEEIPSRKAANTISAFGNYSCPVRVRFKEAFTEASSMQSIDLQAIEGCTNSKSPYRSFKDLSQTSNARFQIEKYRNDPDALAKLMLAGTVDCAVYAGRPGDIYHQTWDNRYWLSNDGGSHRTSALWKLDRDADRHRDIYARVASISISPQFLDFCQENSIFIFNEPDLDILHENRLLFKAQGITTGFEYFAGSGINLDKCCLVVSKSHPVYEEIKNIFAKAFDFSDWALNPQKYHGCDYHLRSEEFVSKNKNMCRPAL